MRYLGGKSKLAKQIAQIINSYRVGDNGSLKDYYEPCVGGAWVLEKVMSPRRYASDIHPDLILLYQAVQSGWLPPEFTTEEEYSKLRTEPSSALRGFVGFACSWGTKWFGGYARGESRNFGEEIRRSLLKEVKFWNGVEFSCKSLFEVKPTNSVVYLDPPYRNTTKYKDTPPIDYNKFDQHCLELKSLGNTVLISEYFTPFQCIAEFKTGRSCLNDNSTQVEKLFLV